ncbi:MAG: hypothetical protein ABEJ40_03870 [Haloarculaceae archaeon]
MRAGGTILVTVLVVLSGCGGLGGGGTATPADQTPATDATGVQAPENAPTGTSSGKETSRSTPTATETPGSTPTATETPTPTPAATTPAPKTPDADASLPPGVRGNGTVNETRLLAAHLAAANRSGWALTHRNGDRTTVAYVAGNESYVHTPDGVTWSRGNATVTNASVFDGAYETSFSRNTTLGGSTGTTPVLFALAVRLGTAEYEWAGTRPVDGTTLHELVMTGTSGFGGKLGRYTGRLLVDDRGRIHRLRGEVGENRSVAETYEFDFSYPVETVPKPAWFDRVPRVTAAKVDGGRALRLTVTGGPALPAGAEFAFSHNGTRRSVTLDEPLGPGESLYLGLRGPDRELVRSRDLPAGDSLVDLDGSQTRLDGTVTVDGTEISVGVRIGRLSL